MPKFSTLLQSISLKNPVNLIFPISGGLYHHHSNETNDAANPLKPRLDMRRHFMKNPFVVQNVVFRQCAPTRKSSKLEGKPPVANLINILRV